MKNTPESRFQALKASVEKGFKSLERGDYAELPASDLLKLADAIKQEGRRRYQNDARNEHLHKE